MLGKAKIYGSGEDKLNTYTISRYNRNYSVKIVERVYGENNDTYHYSEAYEGNTGKFIISATSNLSLDEENNIIPANTVLNVEYYEGSNRTDPTFKTVSRIYIEPKEKSGKEVSKYYVYNESSNGKTKDLEFSYAAEDDFRHQLRNLYSSIIKVPGIENTILGLTEMSDVVNSEEVGLFDACKYSKNVLHVDKVNTMKKFKK